MMRLCGAGAFHYASLKICVACHRYLILLDAGGLPEGLQRSTSGDLDDTSSATESCESASLCDSKPAGTEDVQNPAQGSHGIPGVDTDQVHVTPEQQIWRGFRTPGVHSTMYCSALPCSMQSMSQHSQLRRVHVACRRTAVRLMIL